MHNFIRIILHAIFITTLLAASLAGQTTESVVVIGGKGLAAVSKADLKGLYLGFKTKLPNGAPARLYMNKSAQVKEFFVTQVIGISSDEFKSYWLSKALSGEGVPPPELSTGELVDKIAQEHGAVAFIPKSALTAEMNVILTLP